MMRGETVLVNGAPVDNVLVSVGDHTEGTDARVPAGTVVAYTLAFPSSYEGPLSDAAVTVRGVECRSVGHCDHNRPADVFGGAWIEELCPWDMTVPVRLATADARKHVRVVATSVTYDELGDPVRSDSLAYEGPAQARWVSGARGTSVDGSAVVAETWAFVIPWSAAVAALRPEAARVECDGAVFDAVSVANVDGRGEFASIEGRRRG